MSAIPIIVWVVCIVHGATCQPVNAPPFRTWDDCVSAAVDVRRHGRDAICQPRVEVLFTIPLPNEKGT